MMKFSVLMAVYIKDTPGFFEQALESVLIDQTLLPSEVVLIKDGQLTDELESIIDNFKSKFSDRLKVIGLEQNQGLGRALNIGLEHCNYELVARMDSDDISDKNRFEKQLNIFMKNQEIDLVGTDISEFFDTPDKIKFIRKVPESGTEIKRMAKRRNPLNHVSVMFKKSAVIQAGGYKHLYFLEDYYLWVRMIAKGFNMININESLVYVRTGEEMFNRRSNPEYIKSWYKLQKEMLNYKLINGFDLIINMTNIIGFIYTPPKLKWFLYALFLRESKN